MRIAALDLGTNTFLCLIAEGDSSGISVVHKDMMQVVRLGQEIDKTGSFHPDALARAKGCLESFKKEIDKWNVDKILAMATSAARDAKNGEELFKIGHDLGIPIQIIPGEDEARITFQGAVSTKNSSHSKSYLVVDVGGGSTELILGKSSQLIFGESADIGGVRLTEKFITSQPIPLSERLEMAQYIKKKLSPIIEHIRKHPLDEVVAVAGTPTSIAAIELGGYDDQKVDGFILSRDRLEFWNKEFAETTIQQKKDKYGLGGRADIIFAGSLILLEILRELEIHGLTVSTKGVRYGVALEMLRT
jgi:exopolyphosphatase/guanosine-5'-triphosphate,3'-diphosphate pyrophosphatase